MAAPPPSLTRTEITPLFISQWTLMHHDHMPEGIADAFSPPCSGRWRDQKPDTEEQGIYFLLQRISHIRAAVLSFQTLQISRGSPAWSDLLECNSQVFPMTEVFHKLVHAALLKLRQSPAVSTPPSP